MTIHSHNFVESSQEIVGFGLDRQTDEHTLIWYLQKFSDDTLMETLVKRMSNAELEDMFAMMTKILKTHLSEDEYHRIFLKDT